METKVLLTKTLDGIFTQSPDHLTDFQIQVSPLRVKQRPARTELRVRLCQKQVASCELPSRLQ